MILIVEDHLATAKALQFMTKNIGHDSMIAPTGAQAMEVLAKHRPMLIILDLMLPDISGLNILQSVRQTHSPLELPVVIYSASNHDHTREQAILAGASEFIVKGSVDFAHLKSRVKHHLHGGSSSDAAVKP